MNTANLVMQSKGGAGKSPFSLNLSSYLRTLGAKHAYVDADKRPATSVFYFKDVITPAIDEVMLESGVSEAGVILEKLRVGETLIVDTGAGTQDFFDRFFQLLDFAGKVEAGDFKVNLFIPVDSNRETHFFAAQAIKWYPWAKIYHVHFRTSLNYYPELYPNIDPSRVIVFPFLHSQDDPKKPGIKQRLRDNFKTLDQAVNEHFFPIFLEHEMVVAARNLLFKQLERIKNDITP